MQLKDGLLNVKQKTKWPIKFRMKKLIANGV